MQPYPYVYMYQLVWVDPLGLHFTKTCWYLLVRQVTTFALDLIVDMVAHWVHRGSVDGIHALLNLLVVRSGAGWRWERERERGKETK